MRTPGFVAPMTATLVQALPAGEEWLYEVKLDGYRALLIKDGDSVRIVSRNEKDLTASYPRVAAAGAKLAATTAVLDGEVVALDATGRPSFQALQHRAAHPAHAIVYYAFDLLFLEGRDLTRERLGTRRRLLAPVIGQSGILQSLELEGTVEQIVSAVSHLGLEGVIAKRRDSRYDAGQRSGAWVKLKLERQQELVIGGYRPGTHGVDALVVGFYEGRELRFAGKVRAGFTPHLRRDVFKAIAPLQQERCPFADLPHTGPSRWGGGIMPAEMAEFTWVKPKVVAQIRFVEWTAEHHLRHAAFVGLRGDKRATEVRRER